MFNLKNITVGQYRHAVCACADEYGTIGGRVYKQHHAAKERGYVSRAYKRELWLEPYKGRFGKGYKLHAPRWDTTNYHTVIYYIEESEI